MKAINLILLIFEYLFKVWCFQYPNTKVSFFRFYGKFICSLYTEISRIEFIRLFQLLSRLNTYLFCEFV